MGDSPDAGQSDKADNETGKDGHFGRFRGDRVEMRWQV